MGIYLKMSGGNDMDFNEYCDEYCEQDESGMCSRCRNNFSCCMTAPKRTECDNFDEEDD